jgi:COP9 signalosome complex subunit 7
VISAIYAGLVNATLDPYHQLVVVSSVSPLRDLQPNSIPSMLSTLNEWSARCVSTLADLEKQIASIKAEALKRHKETVEWAAHVEKLIEGKGDSKEKEEKSGGGGVFGGLGRKLGGGAASKRGSGGLDGEDDDNMDLDEEDADDERRGSRSAKKNRGFGNLGGAFGK